LSKYFLCITKRRLGWPTDTLLLLLWRAGGPAGHLRGTLSPFCHFLIGLLGTLPEILRQGCESK